MRQSDFHVRQGTRMIGIAGGIILAILALVLLPYVLGALPAILKVAGYLLVSAGIAGWVIMPLVGASGLSPFFMSALFVMCGLVVAELVLKGENPFSRSDRKGR